MREWGVILSSAKFCTLREARSIYQLLDADGVGKRKGNSSIHQESLKIALGIPQSCPKVTYLAALVMAELLREFDHHV